MRKKSEKASSQGIPNNVNAGMSELPEDLYQEIRPKLCKYACKILTDPDEAEDIVQDVLVKYLFKYRDKLVKLPIENFERFVITMVKNECYMYNRKQQYIRFMITNQTIDQLRCAEVATDILVQLENFQQSEPVGRKQFLNSLKARLENKLTERLQELILKYSRLTPRRHVDPDPTELIIGDYQEFSTPQKELERLELVNCLREHIQQLDEKKREIAKERVFHGKTFKEISKEKNIPLKTLYSRYRKFIDGIRQNAELMEFYEDL